MVSADRSNRPAKRPRIAVVYLARHAEGFVSLQNFRDSYLRHPPGVEHELVVIYKGYDKSADLRAAKALLAPLAHVAFEVSDDGFDITAYLKAAHSLEQDYFCFLNTFTQIAAPNWLVLLAEHATQPDVGIAGAMGSYESLYDSAGLINKVVWLYNKISIHFDESLEKFFGFVIQQHCRSSFRRVHPRSALHPRTLATRLGLMPSLAKKNWRDIPPEEIDRVWSELTKPRGPFFEHGQFPQFPNPHIRSNGFMVARRHLLGRKPSEIVTKMDAFRFESGRDSLTAQIRREGLRAVVVNRAGQAFDISDWIHSETFRLGNQEGLLLTDNQSRQFDAMPPGERATHARFSWGDYLSPPPADFPDLGCKFSVFPDGGLPPPPVFRTPIWTSFLPESPPVFAKRDPAGLKFSFLIPSKNRLELLKFAVDSVRRQDYANFEIIITDNASDEDYAGFVQSLGDARIVYERSPSPIPVTENWNRALQLATGDYILMLGDDDALAPGFMPCMVELTHQYQQPDIVYCAAYHYCYPNVLPASPAGYLADIRNSVLFKNRSAPYLLPLEQARHAARAVGDFRYLFGFNSQHFLFRAQFLKKIFLAGENPAPVKTSAPFTRIFQSPFPDFFAAIVTFMNAQSVLVVPEPMVIIGISPKSFGYYYFNDQLQDGYKFLDNDQVPPAVRESLKDALLPGDQLNTYWLTAAESARRALAPAPGLTPNLERYRRLQMVAFLRGIHVKKLRHENEITPFAAALSTGERETFHSMQRSIEAAASNGQREVDRVFATFDRQLEQYCPTVVTMLDVGPHANVSDAIQGLTRIYTQPPGQNAAGFKKSRGST